VRPICRGSDHAPIGNCRLRTYTPTSSSPRSPQPPSIGEKSLTVEPGTGIVHAVVGAEDGFVLYDRAADGTWTHETLASLGRLSSPVIRQDATSGRLIVAYVQVTFDESTPDRVEIITKG
jgi:hypothetical protein